jgi:hypothetical protein
MVFRHAPQYDSAIALIGAGNGGSQAIDLGHLSLCPAHCRLWQRGRAVAGDVTILISLE